MRKSAILLLCVLSVICVCSSQKLAPSLKNITEADKIKPKKREDNPIKKDIKKYLRECGANVSDEESDEGNNNDNQNDEDEEEDDGDMKQQKKLSGMKSRTGTYPTSYGGGSGGKKNKGTYPTSYGSAGKDDDDDECEDGDSQEHRGRRKNSKNNRRNKRSKKKAIFDIENNYRKGKNMKAKYETIKEGNHKNKEQDLLTNILVRNNGQLAQFFDRKDKLFEYDRMIQLKNANKINKLKKQNSNTVSDLLFDAKTTHKRSYKEDIEVAFEPKTIHKRSNEEDMKDVETFKVKEKDDFERYKNRNDKRRGGGKRKKNDDYDEDSEEEDDDDGCEDSGKNHRGGNRNNNRGKNNRNKNNNRGNKRGGYNSFGGSSEDRYMGNIGNPYGTRYGGTYGGYGGEFGLYDGWGMYGGRLVKMMNATGIEDLVRRRRDVEYDDARDPADVQCLSQCVLGYLEMLDDNRVPSETEVIKYLQNKISNSSLRIKTIREARRCFARLATTDTENGCQFSKSLAQCMKLEIEEKI